MNSSLSLKKHFFIVFLFFFLFTHSQSNNTETLESAKAAYEDNDSEKAKQLINGLDYKTLNGEERYQLQKLIKLLYKNRVGVAHEVNTFLEEYPIQKSWNNSFLEYQRIIGRSAYLARVNYSNRFFTDDVLYEIEGYPVFNDKFYTFLNLNFSSGEFYQVFGASASAYHAIGNGYEIEGGFRYLDFETDEYLSGVIGLTKYISQFYLNARGFLGPQKEETFIQNYQFNLRYYLENPEDYLLLRLGTGISPDDRTRFTQINSNPDLKAFYANIGFRKSLNRFEFQIMGGALFEDLPYANNGTQLLASGFLMYNF